jgi:hypothetical protein
LISRHIKQKDIAFANVVDAGALNLRNMHEDIADLAIVDPHDPALEVLNGAPDEPVPPVGVPVVEDS